MIVVPNWIALQRRVDKIVDARFAQPIELHPMQKGSYSSSTVTDGSRVIVKTTAIPVTPGANAIGEISANGGGGGATQVSIDEWISIQEDLLDPTSWKPGDRVFVPLTEAWFEITYITNSATRRPDIHMVRLQDGSL